MKTPLFCYTNIFIVDLCATNNGGCDPLIKCNRQNDGTRLCSPCPPGYNGTGDTQCVGI